MCVCEDFVNECNAKIPNDATSALLIERTPQHILKLRNIKIRN